LRRVGARAVSLTLITGAADITDDDKADVGARGDVGDVLTYDDDAEE
tara:strand:- start:415 stop:555 length:141 start_codon:yes stop_codon:yes gene_type:complete